MEQTTASTGDAQNIVDDVTDMPMVEKAHVNSDGSIYVGFNVDNVPESFTEEMLSHGYVSNQIRKTAMNNVTIGVVFKNAIGF